MMTLNRSLENSSGPAPNLSPARLEYVDAIRAMAIVGVVLVHVTSVLVRSGGQAKASWWLIGCVANALGHAAVPLFIMISGLLLLDPARQETIGGFLKKRLLRIFVPYAGWAVIYFIWISVVNHKPLTAAYFVRSASDRELWYFIGLWAFSILLLPVLEHISGISLGVTFVVVTGYSGYFVLGHVLGKIHLTAFVRTVAIVCFAASWVGVSMANWYAGRFPGSAHFLDLLAADYLTPAICLMSVCGFVLIRSLSFEKVYKTVPVLKRTIMALSVSSFSIFFMQMIPLEILRYGSLGITLNAFTVHPLFGIPCTVAAVCIICAGVALVFRKIPVVKIFFP